MSRVLKTYRRGVSSLSTLKEAVGKKVASQFNVKNVSNAAMLLAGFYILEVGLADLAEAQASGSTDHQIRCAAAKLLELTEGSLGALIMVAAGMATIIACAFGAYSAATSLLCVAVGGFILRSLVMIFFNDGLVNLNYQNCIIPGTSVLNGAPPGESGSTFDDLEQFTDGDTVFGSGSDAGGWDNVPQGADLPVDGGSGSGSLVDQQWGDDVEDGFDLGGGTSGDDAVLDTDTVPGDLLVDF